ncbi:MAG: TonB-dependent receptor [Bacteroidota bacterium]
MHRWYMFFICLLPLFVYGNKGNEEEPDTLITLDQIEVSAQRFSTFGSGYTVHRLDTNVLQGQYDQGIDFILSRHSGVFVKNYGPGILATSSLRGGTAGQTSLLWNGFKLESPMNGQADLALFPAFFADEAGVQYGGSTALWGSGSMGGAIHLDNQLGPQEGFNMSAGFSGGSLGELAQHVRLSWGKRAVSTRVRMFNSNSSNRYDYKNTAMAGNPVLTQEHASAGKRGLLHETHIALNERHKLDIRWWWQQNNRNIPPTMLQNHTGAYQEDGALRITGEWQASLSPGVFRWRGGYFDQSLLYRDSLNKESLSGSKSLIQEAGMLLNPLPSLLVKGGINARWVRATADKYQENKEDKNLAFFGLLRWDAISDRLQFMASGRQAFTEETSVPFAPSFGLSWQAGSHMLVKANAGKNYRLPTMNDKYWSPGGNPDLKPEQGWSQDVGLTFKNPEENIPSRQRHPFSAALEKVSLTGFHKKISNQIVWLPRQGSMYWRPENLAAVRSYGVEARIRGSIHMQTLQLQWQARWDHVIAKNTMATSPNDQSAGKQLIHVPKNSLGYNLHLEYQRFSLHFNHQYTGRRYTNSDNTAWLNPYHTGDIGIQWHTTIQGHKLRAFANVINLWNESYQVMSGRPMPLRHYRAGLKMTLTK